MLSAMKLLLAPLSVSEDPFARLIPKLDVLPAVPAALPAGVIPPFTAAKLEPEFIVILRLASRSIEPVPDVTMLAFMPVEI